MPDTNVLELLEKVPGQVVELAKRFIQMAEDAFGGKTGELKKKWVVDQLCTLLDLIDIPWIPNSIEPAIKRALVSCLVQILFSLSHLTEFTLNGDGVIVEKNIPDARMIPVDFLPGFPNKGKFLRQRIG